MFFAEAWRGPEICLLFQRLAFLKVLFSPPEGYNANPTDNKNKKSPFVSSSSTPGTSHTSRVVPVLLRSWGRGGPGLGWGFAQDHTAISAGGAWSLGLNATASSHLWGREIVTAHLPAV